MDMRNTKFIDFKELDSIKSRSAIRSFFEFSADIDAVVVDFAKITFLSRTAAHEMLVLQNNLSSQGMDISFLNVSASVNAMLELVKNSLGKEKKVGFRFVKLLTFEDDKKYEDYLLQL